jgi:hypothetical protein
MDVVVDIYLASPTRWAHLRRTLDLHAVPRVGEHLKLRNAEMGDYFPFRVVEVTHREGAAIEVMTGSSVSVATRSVSTDRWTRW